MRWDDSANDWRVEDNNGTQRVLYHSGNIPNATITISAGNGLTTGGAFTTNQSSNETITINHADTSSQSSVNNGGGTVVQDISLDTYGHITNINSINLDSRYLGITAKAADANLLDGLNSTQFLRSDASDSMTGNLTVSGTVNAANFNSTSDERVKENVRTIDNALEKATQLRGVYYTRIGEQDPETGVIAQEIEKILPEVVSEDESGAKSVAYGNVIGLLIEAIKDLKEEIDDLKKQ
jgi:hypothetical protein